MTILMNCYVLFNKNQQKMLREIVCFMIITAKGFAIVESGRVRNNPPVDSHNFEYPQTMQRPQLQDRNFTFRDFYLASGSKRPSSIIPIICLTLVIIYCLIVYYFHEYVSRSDWSGHPQVREDWGLVERRELGVTGELGVGERA